MKLKSPPASATADAVVRLPEATVPHVPEAAVRARFSPPPRPPAPDPLASLVRKFVNHRDRENPAAVEPAAGAVNGTVLAETHIDGVRYVMLRCAPKPNEALLSLSPRERDIVNLIIKGYPNKMIAELLEISAWTVGTHLRRIFAKLGVTSRAAMVARYLHYVGD